MRRLALDRWSFRPDPGRLPSSPGLRRPLAGGLTGGSPSRVPTGRRLRWSRGEPPAVDGVAPTRCAPRSGWHRQGLAADLVAREAMAAGATGVLVNVGGDVRVQGSSPDAGPWRLDVEVPAEVLRPGRSPASASSRAASPPRAPAGRTGRSPTAPSCTMSSIPTTGLPAVSAFETVTVVAGSGGGPRRWPPPSCWAIASTASTTVRPSPSTTTAASTSWETDPNASSWCWANGSPIPRERAMTSFAAVKPAWWALARGVGPRRMAVRRRQPGARRARRRPHGARTGCHPLAPRSPPLDLDDRPGPRRPARRGPPGRHLHRLRPGGPAGPVRPRRGGRWPWRGGSWPSGAWWRWSPPRS